MGTDGQRRGFLDLELFSLLHFHQHGKRRIYGAVMVCQHGYELPLTPMKYHPPVPVHTKYP